MSLQFARYLIGYCNLGHNAILYCTVFTGDMHHQGNGTSDMISLKLLVSQVSPFIRFINIMLSKQNINCLLSFILLLPLHAQTQTHSMVTSQDCAFGKPNLRRIISIWNMELIFSTSVWLNVAIPVVRNWNWEPTSQRNYGTPNFIQPIFMPNLHSQLHKIKNSSTKRLQEEQEKPTQVLYFLVSMFWICKVKLYPL